MYKRSAIALMITLFFIMAISVVLGISLKQLKEATHEVENANFTLQTSVILDDVLTILKNSADLNAIYKDGSKETLYIFLSEASLIPFEIDGIKVLIELKSARTNLNINSLVDSNGTANIKRVKALEEYLFNYNVNSEYVSMLVDSMSKVKDDMSYNSAIFNENTHLFRDYIASKEHLEEVNGFFTKSFNDNALDEIAFEKLFYYSKERDSKVDLNYVNAELWRLLIACDELRAEELSLGGGSYEKLEDLNLNEEEKMALEVFSVSFYEPFLDISVEINEGASAAKIRFEYDMKSKKGSNFVYDI
ncbi:MAG: hypothetical protein U9Q40_07295 [Campylobacterota bacterium]|nr:hypothetical protein [Campylobacterota bacterium]